MKVIPKFQKGGLASFFTTYTPITPPADSARNQVSSQESAPRSRRSSKIDDDDDDNSKGKLTEKDLFTMLKEIDGLPNDMENLANSLLSTLEFNKLTGNTQDIATAYLQSLIKMKTYSSNKTEFDEAIKEADKNGVMNELAIAQNGNLVVQSKDGSLTSVSLDTYSKNKDKYELLTNSNLAWLRKNSSQFVNNNSVLEVIKNGMSYERFVDLVDKAKVSLGTTTQTTPGIINATNQQEATKGLETLAQLSQSGAAKALNSISVKGLYDYKLITKDQAMQINSLLQFMMKTMPSNARTWAAVKTNNLDENKALEEVLLNYLMSQQSITEDFDINFAKSENDIIGNSSKSKNSKSSDGNDNDDLEDVQLNAPSLFIVGYGQKNNFVLNPGTQYSLVVNSNMQNLTDAESNPLGAMCTLQEVTQGEWGGSLDWNNVTMAGRKISSSFFNQVLLSEGQAHSIDYPTNQDGTPMFTQYVIENRQKAEEDLKNNNIDLNNPVQVQENSKKVSEVLIKYGLPPMFDENGRYITGNWGRFAVMNAIADNEILELGETDYAPSLLQQITDENRLAERDQVLTNKLNRTFKTEYGNYVFSNDLVYEGTLWVPVNTDLLNSLVGSGKTVKAKEAEYIDTQQQIRDNLLKNYSDPNNKVQISS